MHQDKTKKPNATLRRRRNRKRADKTSGRKKPRARDTKRKVPTRPDEQDDDNDYYQDSNDGQDLCDYDNDYDRDNGREKGIDSEHTGNSKKVRSRLVNVWVSYQFIPFILLGLR
jgi:hypothetical protein